MLLFQPNKLIKSIYPKAVWNIKSPKPTLYLTFDDGPVEGLTEWVLDTLKEYNVKATFFCVGENIKKQPEVFERIVKEGHSLGNHTYNHLKGLKHNSKEYMENVNKCEPLTNSKLFRPPYGQLKPSQYKALIKNGYKIVMWDVISYDYEKITPERCFRNVKKTAKKGSIIVFHDNYKAEKNIKYTLPKTLDYFLKLNYNFAPL